MPKVSICIPTYNNLADVKRLIDSIRVQTFRDYEVIISDDSTDGAIEFYFLEGQIDGALNEKLQYYHNSSPLGHIFNWNKSISYANGEYIKIMFSDDWFTMPESLEIMVGALDDNPQARMVFSGSMQVSNIEEYKRIPTKGYVDNLMQDYRYLFVSNQIGAPSDILYKKKTEISFDEKSNFASDVFFYFELLKNNCKFIYLNLPLISIGIHEAQYTESFTEKDMRIYTDYEYLYQKYNLRDCKICKNWFLSQYVVKYQVGFKRAKMNGYCVGEYIRAEFHYFWEYVIINYTKALINNIISNKHNTSLNKKSETFHENGAAKKH